jgi:hypothetical protein
LHNLKQSLITGSIQSEEGVWEGSKLEIEDVDYKWYIWREARI